MSDIAKLYKQLQPYIAEELRKSGRGGGTAGATPTSTAIGIHDINVYHSGSLAWSRVDKAGSALASLASRDHNMLTGLGADDHTQYVHNSTARTISARHLMTDGLSITRTTDSGLSIGNGNVGYLRVGSSGWYDDGTTFNLYGSRTANLGDAQVTSADADTSYTFGRARVSNIGQNDSAGFSHRAQATATNYALRQESNGATIHNAATGQQISSRINNAETMAVNDTRLMPAGSILKDLGDYNRKWRSLYAAELYVETLVAQDVLATIGGRVMVAPTTTLIADVGSGDTTIDVKHNLLANGTFTYMAAAPGGIAQIESMKVTSGATNITGGYRYSVTRNQDGTGANSWVAGDAVVDLANEVGEGYIDLSSTNTIHGHIGPTITIYSRSGTTVWNDSLPVVSMGNLRSWVDYSTDAFGFAIGGNLTLDQTNGFKGLTADATNGVRLFSTAISLYNGSLQTVSIQPDGDILAGANIGAVNTTSLSHFAVSQTYDGEAFGAGDLMLGDHGTANVLWDASAGQLKFRGGTTTRVYVDTNGRITAGSGDVSLDDDGVAILTDSSFNASNRVRFLWSSLAGAEQAHVGSRSYDGANYQLVLSAKGVSGGAWGSVALRARTSAQSITTVNDAQGGTLLVQPENVYIGPQAGLIVSGDTGEVGDDVPAGQIRSTMLLLREIADPGAAPADCIILFKDAATGNLKARFETGAAVTVAISP